LQPLANVEEALDDADDVSNDGEVKKDQVEPEAPPLAGPATGKEEPPQNLDLPVDTDVSPSAPLSSNEEEALYNADELDTTSNEVLFNRAGPESPAPDLAGLATRRKEHPQNLESHLN